MICVWLMRNKSPLSPGTTIRRSKAQNLNDRTEVKHPSRSPPSLCGHLSRCGVQRMGFPFPKVTDAEAGSNQVGSQGHTVNPLNQIYFYTSRIQTCVDTWSLEVNVGILAAVKDVFFLEKREGDFPGGTVVKNPPANAEDTGSIPGPGRSHMPRATKPMHHNHWDCFRAREPQLLKPLGLEPGLCNKRSHRNEKPTYHKEDPTQPKVNKLNK